MNAVSEALVDLAKTYDEKERSIGDDNQDLGATLLGLFPRGLRLATSPDFYRFALLVRMLTKFTQYSRSLEQGRGNPEALDDIAIYSRLLQACDTTVFGSHRSRHRRPESTPERESEPEEVKPEPEMPRAVSRRMNGPGPAYTLGARTEDLR